MVVLIHLLFKTAFTPTICREGACIQYGRYQREVQPLLVKHDVKSLPMKTSSTMPFTLLISLLLCICCSCKSNNEYKYAQNVGNTGNISLLPMDDKVENSQLKLKSKLLELCEDKRFEKAWKQLTSSNQYRLANKADFKTPEEIKNGYDLLDTEEAIQEPIITGDINHDNNIKDRAAIIIDNFIKSDNRFSIVIFNEPSKKDHVYEIHWLYKNKDLSTTKLGWASSGLTIGNYKISRGCFVRWNRQKQQYYCN